MIALPQVAPLEVEAYCLLSNNCGLATNISLSYLVYLTNRTLLVVLTLSDFMVMK